MRKTADIGTSSHDRGFVNTSACAPCTSLSRRKNRVIQTLSLELNTIRDQGTVFQYRVPRREREHEDALLGA